MRGLLPAWLADAGQARARRTLAHGLARGGAAGDRAMAMVGSVVTRDMAPNHVYGGSPAIDLTAKVGPQFAPVTVADLERLAQTYADLGDDDAMQAAWS